VIYDYLSPEMAADPYPAYERLREEAPVFYDEEHDLWSLSRYADVQTAFRDWGTFTSTEGVDPDDLARETGMDVLLTMDPPRHDVVRKVLRDRFTPKAVRVLGEQTKRVIGPLVADVAQSDHADLAAMAKTIAARSMADFMGISDATSDRLQAGMERMLSGLGHAADPDSERPLPPAVYEGAQIFWAAMEDELERRHHEEIDDMTASIARGEVAGVLDRHEAISACAVAYFGALDTTAAAIEVTLYLLAELPALRSSVVAGELPIGQVLEECIRYHAPIQWVMRTTTRDVELHDRTMPKGARVLLLQGSANRDPRQFENPDVVDVHRPRQRHFAFGEGVHFCIGAPLARLWATTAISELLRHAPEYELDGRAVRTATSMGYGMESMPARLRP
jgi:cytochrome P450